MSSMRNRRPTASQTARYRAQCTMIFQIGEGDEFRDIDLGSTAGFLVGDVDEPFELRRYIGEAGELIRRQCTRAIDTN